MAARRLVRLPKLTPRDAQSAIKWLVATGELSAKQVTDALKRRDQLVADIKVRLEQLGDEGLRFLTSAAALKPRKGRRIGRKASAKARAAWRAQGRYLAAVRRLSKANRAKVRALRQKKGIAAALASAKKMAAR